MENPFAKGQDRITDLNCNLKDIIVKLVGGNLGATVACCEIIANVEHIDPDSALGPLGPLLQFDTLRIYEERIYMLFNDVCERNIVKVIALLRAVQLSMLSESVLNHAIDNRGEGLNVMEYVSKVKKRLPDFNKDKIGE